MIDIWCVSPLSLILIESPIISNWDEIGVGVIEVMLPLVVPSISLFGVGCILKGGPGYVVVWALFYLVAWF